MSESSAFSITSQVTVGDVFQAIALYNWRRSWWFLVLVPTVGIISLFLELSGVTRRAPNLMFLAGGILCIGLGALLAFVIPYWTARSAFNSNKTLQQPGQYTFSDVGIDLMGQSYRSQTEWTNIHGVQETGKYLMLFLSSQMFFLIPKRSLTNDDIIRIRVLIDRHVRGKVQLQR